MATHRWQPRLVASGRLRETGLVKSLRLLLMLCLCVAVPFSATAALLDGPASPEQSPAVAVSPHGHDHASQEHADAAGIAKASHCVAGDDGEPCPDSHCRCGCGLGLCAVAFHFQAARPELLLLVAPMRLSVGEHHAAHAEPMAGALLRPPIA